MKGKWGIIVLVLAIGGSASGIVWRGDRTVTRSAGDGPAAVSPVGVMEYSGTRSDRGSAVLIGDDVILTAGHQIPPYGATAVFKINGESYLTTGWRVHPKFRKAGGNEDLAVGQLVGRVTSVAPAEVFTANLRSGAAVTIIGCGGSGPIGFPLQWNWQPISGTNKLSSVSKAVLRTSFDRPGRNATEYESHLVPGDSGGGIFVLDQGVWKLAGIAISRSGANYGASSTFVRLMNHHQWIRQAAFGDGRIQVDFRYLDFVGSVEGDSARFELIPTGTTTPIAVHEGPLNAASSFSGRTLHRGTFDVRVKTQGRLSRVIHNVAVTAAPIPSLQIELTAGDINNDNAVDLLDLSLVNAQLGATGENSADVNGDAIVDAADLGLVQSHLGLTGE